VFCVRVLACVCMCLCACACPCVCVFAYACACVCVRVSQRVLCVCVCVKIPAKKWGDTEIAERGRSVLVMRARYRSAGLIPHQRGWTDAG